MVKVLKTNDICKVLAVKKGNEADKELPSFLVEVPDVGKLSIAYDGVEVYVDQHKNIDGSDRTDQVYKFWNEAKAAHEKDPITELRRIAEGSAFKYYTKQDFKLWINGDVPDTKEARLEAAVKLNDEWDKAIPFDPEVAPDYPSDVTDKYELNGTLKSDKWKWAKEQKQAQGKKKKKQRRGLNRQQTGVRKNEKRQRQDNRERGLNDSPLEREKGLNDSPGGRKKGAAAKG